METFRAATEYARHVTAGLTSDALGLPTPCDGWSTGTVVMHLADVAVALNGLVRTGELRMPEPPRTAGPHPVPILNRCLDQLLDTLSTTSDAERTRSATQAGAIEFTTHSWDIAVASNLGHRISEQLAGGVLDLARSLISDDQRGTRFAARIDAPTTAPLSDHLTAFLGRRPMP